jgi:hypothetical protein
MAIKSDSWIETGAADQYFQLSHCAYSDAFRPLIPIHSVH